MAIKIPNRDKLENVDAFIDAENKNKPAPASEPTKPEAKKATTSKPAKKPAAAPPAPPKAVERVSVTARIPIDIMDEVKLLALTRREKQEQLIAAALRFYLDNQKG